MVFNKKGQGEQFNWIFIIVSGTIILAFFSVFTMKYIQLQELKQNIEIGRNFGQSMNILQNSPIVGRERGLSIDSTDSEGDGAFKIGVRADMDYSCDDIETSIMFNKEPRSIQHLENEILFAPTKLKMNALDMWVLPWQYPFFISNVLFLSDPRADYYFIYDADNQKFVEDLYIPSNLRVKKLSVSKVNVDGGEVGRFVFFTTSKDSATKRISELSKKYTTADFKYIKLADVNGESGDVTFLSNSRKDEGKTKFIGKPMLWGSIFSSEFDTYNCSYNKALKKVNSIGEVYLGKMDLLARTEGFDCQSFYSAMRNNVVKLAIDFSKDGFKQSAIIETENNDLAGRGCSYVY